MMSCQSEIPLLEILPAEPLPTLSSLDHDSKNDEDRLKINEEKRKNVRVLIYSASEKFRNTQIVT